MLTPVPARRPLRTKPATTLKEIAQTFHPDALVTAEELNAFYKPEIDAVRGINRTGELRLGLEDAHASQIPFKAFLIGHPGVGKTTELSRLLLEEEQRFRALRLSVTDELNPGTLRYYDILLLILIRLVYEATRPPVNGFEDTDLQNMLADVRDHLATKWTKHLQVKSKEFGAGLTVQFSRKAVWKHQAGPHPGTRLRRIRIIPSLRAHKADESGIEGVQ